MAIEYQTVEINFSAATAAGEYTRNLGLPQSGKYVTGITLLETSDKGGTLTDYEIEIQATRGQSTIEQVPKDFYKLKHNTAEPFWQLSGWRTGNRDSVAKVVLPDSPSEDLRFKLVFVLKDEEDL